MATSGRPLDDATRKQLLRQAEAKASQRDIAKQLNLSKTTVNKHIGIERKRAA